jgi:hypothetical protein
VAIACRKKVNTKLAGLFSGALSLGRVFGGLGVRAADGSCDSKVEAMRTLFNAVEPALTISATTNASSRGWGLSQKEQL